MTLAHDHESKGAGSIVTDHDSNPYRPVNPHTKKLRERYQNPWRWLLVFTPPIAYVSMFAMGFILQWLRLGIISHIVAVFMSFPVAIGVAAGVAEYITERRLVRWLIVIANGVLIALPWGYILMVNAIKFGK